MTQDLADQLTAETVKDTVRNRLTANYSYGYDANGNRTSDSAGPYTTNNVNQITNSGYTYDLNGNLLSDGTRTYEWDAANRLVAINQGRQRSEFSYESSGHFARIVEKDRGRVTSDTRYVWNGVKLLEMRDTATGNVLVRYYGQGAVVTPGTNPLRLYATFDHLGSVREVTDASGNLQARYDYDPYGKPTQLAGRIQSNILYAGYFYHAPSGLYFTQHRAYDPGVGRWLSRDPIGEKGGLNSYGYGGNNPAIGIDPSGLLVVVPLADKQAYRAAWQYLNQDPSAHRIFKYLNSTDSVYTLHTNSSGDDRFDHNTNTINWDPNAAFNTYEGGRQSAALQLLHEMDHAAGWDISWLRYLDRLITPYDDYSNLEERRVIDGAERDAALSLGEDVRCDHYNWGYVHAGQRWGRV